MSTDYLWWSVGSDRTRLPKEVTTIVVESLSGKRRIFVPGRRSTPFDVARYHEQIIAHCLKAILEAGWEVNPENLIGVPILTEGLGAPFFYAFNQVWPGAKMGGLASTWAKRKQVGEKGPKHTHDPFTARVIRIDTTAFERLKEAGRKGTLLLFDIGATGATLEAVIPELLALNQVERIIFASPCTSLNAAKAFVETATIEGMKLGNLAVIANEGFFGLYENGTFLSLQLPGTITSHGNLALSRIVYPYPAFCHIGAGGLAANCQDAYEEELREDEEREELGPLPIFASLEDAMNHAGVRWPDDFGPPL